MQNPECWILNAELTLQTVPSANPAIPSSFKIQNQHFFPHMIQQRLFIVSLPRSGSTVLTTILDRHEDILCLPESHFPAVLARLDDCDLQDPDRMAALFLASCPDGSPLTYEEARECMHGDIESVLDSVAAKVALKIGRSPDNIRVVVWKYTRLIGASHKLAASGGRFIILRRNPLNVFESQFRVPFGRYNRNPARFALFEASYEAAFGRYPLDKTIEIHYSDIPDSIASLISLVGSLGRIRKDAAHGVGEHSGKMPWHSEINRPFRNADADKLGNLKPSQVISYRSVRTMLTCLPFIGKLARHFADQRELKACRKRAAEVQASLSLMPSV